MPKTILSGPHGSRARADDGVQTAYNITTSKDGIQRLRNGECECHGRTFRRASRPIMTRGLICGGTWAFAGDWWSEPAAENLIGRLSIASGSHTGSIADEDGIGSSTPRLIFERRDRHRQCPPASIRTQTTALHPGNCSAPRERLRTPGTASHPGGWYPQRRAGVTDRLLVPSSPRETARDCSTPLNTLARDLEQCGPGISRMDNGDAGCFTSAQLPD